jgi:hypothetical protein
MGPFFDDVTFFSRTRVANAVVERRVETRRRREGIVSRGFGRRRFERAADEKKSPLKTFSRASQTRTLE